MNPKQNDSIDLGSLFFIQLDVIFSTVTNINTHIPCFQVIFFRLKFLKAGLKFTDLSIIMSTHIVASCI